MSEFSGFINYKQTVIDLIAYLDKEQDYCLRLGLEETAALIGDMIKKLKQENFNIAILGEFNRGKSTLINALLEKDVLPTSWKACTATINKVIYNVSPAARIEYKDGRIEEIPFDNLKNYVTKLSKESEKTALSIKEVTVGYPLSYCQNGVSIYDTPGLNDDASMTEVTLGILPKVDAAIMVIMANIPLGQTEQIFLESKLISGDVGRVIFVVTGIDIIGEDAVDEVLENIREKINEGILKKAADVYGVESSQYKDAKRKLGSIKIFGLSAKQALDAKLNKDSELLKQSRFDTFEAELERFLTEDRGAVMLSAPISRIDMAGGDIVKAIAMRKSALNLSAEQFNENYKIALKKIEEIRGKRNEEMEKIDSGADRTYSALSDKIADYWPSIRETAIAAVDSFEITDKMIKNADAKKETAELILEKMKSDIAIKSQNNVEAIQSVIEGGLLKQIDSMSSFEDYFFNETDSIKSMFISDSVLSANNNDVGIQAAATAISSLFGYGVGGVIIGYNKAGWKGALIGGASAFVGTLGSSLIISSIATALAIPLAGPVLFVGIAVMALTGTLTANKVLDAIYKGKEIQKFKEQIKKSINEQIDEMSRENNIGATVKKQVDDTFDALKAKVKKETEAVLKDLQSQLDKLNVEVGKNEIEMKKTYAELDAMEAELKKISASCSELTAKLTAVLKQGE